ncbi:MAG: hypothetical protein B6U76_09825 [Desulfurococcales archaeon ex4484_217_2]|nr:MAG: hypothetical protein B6U76_09825 [Desulfurococcales archaeon ex4484_217_2]
MRHEKREVRLSDVEEGRIYRIVRIEGTRMVRRRILDLGLLPGLKIKVVRRAPLKDPIEVVAKGNPISIRRAEASYVVLEEVEE